MKSWHAAEAAEVARELDSDIERGLTEREAAERLKKFGPNELIRKSSFRMIRIIWDQIRSPLVFVLIIAGAVSWRLGDIADTAIIFLTVGINTVIGAYQEGRASRAFEKLRQTLEARAFVWRDGKESEVDARTIVQGDIILLQDGVRVPADARLITAKGLEINEAPFTGEWAPVSKSTEAQNEAARLPERRNMLWMGTLVTEGQARAVVVATGNASEFGKIARSVENEKRELTPFQKGVTGLARVIGILILSIVAVIFLLGIVRGHTAAEMFLTSIAIAVAAIPEGLPVAVTVVLAIGMYRILAKGGLVRKLVAAETLGSTTVILTDKTGTLTTGEMRVASLITAEGDEPPHAKTKAAQEALRAGALASTAFVENPEDDTALWRVRGKPTDRAMLMAGIESGLRPAKLEAEMPRIDSLPFDAERRYAASLHHPPVGGPGGNRLYFSGAPETLLSHSTKLLTERGEIALDDARRDEFLQQNQQTAERGMRVIAVASRDAGNETEIRRKADGLRDLTFLGLIAFHDPIRPDVRDVVGQSTRAGIRTVILTGDHLATARAVAIECGVLKDTDDDTHLVEGPELEAKSESELKALVGRIAVFARVLPHQKLSIAKAWQAEGAVVAMTGDGINDAPALHGADIGVALGSGTDVAKEASDMVLLQDSFAVIVRAIEEGRVILDNLRKIITYLLAANFSEIFLIGGALFFGLPVPILPGQILWANIAEEGFMNFALAFEPKERDVLRRDPTAHSSKKLLTSEMYFLIFGVGILTALFLFGMYVFLLRQGVDLAEIRTIMFVGVSLDALIFAFSFKSLRQSLWRIPIFHNPYFFAALGASIAVLLGAIYIPPLRDLLKLEAIHPVAVAALAGIAVFNLAAIECGKWLFIHHAKKRRMSA
ncbi:MAG: HAD-IC family P-type ATPase [Candidatus Niyogibacteria bacterium]|nr:HAD-IC family P-type ATPase [Candidatus Niyogibacteria bacterium]